MRRFAKRATKGAQTFVEQQTATLEQRPMLDEATFQQLLAAAYVIQQQPLYEEKAQPLWVPPPPPPRIEPDAADTLSLVAETQRRLQVQPTDLPAAAKLVADCLRKITNATGVGIALVRQDQLEYCAALGSLAPFLGCHIPMSAELSAMPSLVDELAQEATAALVKAAMASNTLTLPLHHEGKIAGLLEAEFENGIQEHDVRSCQLMAGLMTQTIARVEELHWKSALAAERATMIEVLEKIRPQLERLAGNPLAVVPQPEVREIAPQAPEPVVVEPVQSQPVLAPPEPIKEPVAAATDAVCRQCGYNFGIGELFCGRCGTARSSEGSGSGDLQSKWASLWHLQQAAEKEHLGAVEDSVPEEQFDFSNLDEPPTAVQTTQPDIRIIDIPEIAADPEQPIEFIAPHSDDVVTTAAKSSIPWTSSVHTRKWLESLQPDSPARLWITRNRANLYLGIAVLLLVVAISGLGTRNSTPSAVSNQPSLSLFEEALVKLGLAEPPPAPVYAGNPNSQVWVDLHTALYYCSGSDLYGKTPNGKYTTQRDAQMDHFEPAANRSCN